MPITTRSRPAVLASVQGFTLIELLIAITLSAVVLTAARMAFSTAIDSQRRGSRVATSAQAWRFFSARFQHDMRNLVAVKARTLSGLADRIDLHAGGPDSQADGIRYRLVRTPAGGQIRRSVVLAAGSQSESVVYEPVEDFQLRYRQGQDWRDKTQGPLPAAINCRVQADGVIRDLVVALEVDPYSD